MSSALALATALAVGLLPKALAAPVNLVLTLLLTVLYGSQMVYCFIFGTPFASRFAFSAEILRNNYYQHAFGHPAATAPDG